MAIETNNKDFIVKDGLLTAYIGNAERVVVPEGISAVGKFAFEGNEKISTVILPNSVREIGRAAFAKCVNLTNISLPASLTDVEALLFSFCKSLTKITIPRGVEHICRLAFYQCESLAEISLPDALTAIGANAFQGCGALRSIVLPHSLQRIGDRALSCCASLRNVSVLSESLDLGCELFWGSFVSAPSIRVEYAGSADDFTRMIFSNERAPRPWETIGNAVSHVPASEREGRFEYDSETAFCIEVICQKDGARLTFGNAAKH